MTGGGRFEDATPTAERSRPEPPWLSARPASGARGRSSSGAARGAGADDAPRYQCDRHHATVRHPQPAAQRTGGAVALQGNLDPAVCLAPVEVVQSATREVLKDAAGLPGHIFNLGHGVLPETVPGVLRAVVDLVHEETAR